MGESGNNLAIVAQPPQPAVIVPNYDNSNLRRGDFPQGFVFGTGTGAYQVEGAAAVGGKGPSVWDSFTLRTPGRIADGSNGNVAVDMYNRFKEDIRTMKAMGFDAYRFSISWPRILPGGRCSAGINRKGIDYYNDLIDTIIAHGMQPYVTLFHWDLPDILEKEYNGFLSKNIVSDFCEFVELCFWEFGDRVKRWTTINEPWTYALNGYVRGVFPPGKVSSPPHRVLKKLPAHRSIQHPNATVPITRSYSDVKYDKSDPAKDVYIVARNLLLAHAAAVHLYRTKFEVFQKGQIGIVLCSHWHVPLDENSDEDKAAVRRAVDFMLGWFLDPVLYGRYPQNMIDFVPPENLAPFTHLESQMLKGSIDYVGINYYTTNYVSYDPNPEGVGYDADQKLEFHVDRNGKPIGDPSGSTWLYIVPWGIYEHLVYLKKTYPNIPPIYITENGVSDKNDFKLTAKAACVDPTRTKYHQDHLAYLLKAINEAKVDVKGYFVWSWCDNFEWVEGYMARFGIIYIDYMNNRTRHAKNSAVWFAQFLKGSKNIIPPSNKRQIEEDSENVPEKRSRAQQKN
ncbi:Beta-glucosidase, lactase phlorizinhydrolase [Handroanthus impetiginosus]|uniref:Beta-glucosidase, lactase phlorizinhydrolase n=1 Tax=Handroanthus impetiginosus TaxID=429701 RepID=A0A2G9HT66_9LAMI|nr:Beta-glucosidase, lactase phlorizinhydrolase [Handroanthus impetiginosus]